MIATPVTPTLRLPPEEHPRSLGIHVSGVIRCLASEAGILKPEWVESLDMVDVTGADWWSALTSANKLRIAIGLAWEQWYSKTLETVSFHPGELCLEGIYGTPDGEELSTVKSYATLETDEAEKLYALICHEFKSTYKSVNTVCKVLDTQWMWLTQIKCYCKAMGTRFGKLHVLFLCGDYKYPITPQLRVWDIEFTQAEIDESWSQIMDYVKYRMAADREEAGLEGGV